jgi:glycosyltransferase involved in cell wall biosynthesis
MDRNFASLVVLSYKRPEMLKRSLESLKANTNVPYELIVVDDGSRDECWDYPSRRRRSRL